MDIKSLDKELLEIVEKKNKLLELGYDSEKYDDLEEELHDLEDDFIEKYGDYLEDMLEDVHMKICPDTDVLLPIAYIANQYVAVGKNNDGTHIYEVPPKEGVIVEADKYPDKVSRLVLIPNPLRLMLMNGKNIKEIVWENGELKV